MPWKSLETAADGRGETLTLVSATDESTAIIQKLFDLSLHGDFKW
jgi:hypothetical protein